jgi:ABC-2 type transport system ATP-binding protein
MKSNDQSIILKVENLSKRYGPITAVNAISFSVYRGEVLGFLGPNGAGKSTTIDLISTLQKPSGGHIAYPGLAQANQPHTVRQHIGIVPQELALYGNMYGLSESQLKLHIDALLNQFGLKEKAHMRARTLSGGMKRRLNFALADIHDPDLIILDEPTVGLDPNARLMVWKIIQDFRQAGKTVLLTTHYMEEAEALCDRIILIDHGHIITQGTPLELKTALSNELVLSYQLASMAPTIFTDELNKQPGVRSVSSEGNSLRIVVARRAAEAVKTWIAGTNLGISEMQTQDISLGDVFVHFTGHHLRDDDKET